MAKSIWIINHYALTPSQGGLCRHYYFARELLKRGYKVRIFSSSAIHNTSINMIDEGDKSLFKDVDNDGITYTYIKSSAYKGNGISRIKNMLGFAAKIKKIRKKYKGEKPDVIYTSSPDPFTAYTAQKLAKKIKVPIITEVRDLWPLSIVEYKNFSNHNPAIWALYKMEKKLYKRTNALVFTMEGGKDYIKEKGWDKKVDLGKVFYINNGVDVAEQDRQREEYVLSDPDLEDDSFKIIYAGSVRTANSVDLIVKAAERLKDEKNIKFIIYGDGDKREALEAYCAENGLENVKFKGKVDKKYIPYICSKASVNIISVKQTKISLYGVSWNKLFDYMSAGRPILSNVKVNYDLLERYNCGISLESQDAASIADGILKIFEIPSEQYEQMCINAKNAAADFDYEKLTDRVEEVINFVCKG